MSGFTLDEQNFKRGMLKKGGSNMKRGRGLSAHYVRLLLHSPTLSILFHFSIRDDLTFVVRVLFMILQVRKGGFSAIFVNLTKLVTNHFSWKPFCKSTDLIKFQ